MLTILLFGVAVAIAAVLAYAATRSAIQGRQAYLAKMMCLFFDMDKMVGADFAAGLASLKAVVETSISGTPRPA